MIKIIRTENEHKKALAEIEDWMLHQERQMPIHLDSLIDAVVKYEEIHFPMEWEK